MKTLGADTTAIFVSAVHSHSSSLASVMAVSFVYYFSRLSLAQMLLANETYPEL